MSEIKLFQNAEFGQVRVVMLGGEPWFVAKDVCDCLGHSNSRVAVGALDEDEKGVSKVYTPGGEQEMTVVSESGLYNLVIRSNKPEAKVFRRWVTHDVLPQIRKTGMYMPDFDDPVAAARAWADEREAKIKAQLEAQAAQKALTQKSAALTELLDEWGEGETFRSVIAERDRIVKYFDVKYQVDPGDSVYKQLGQLMTKLCNGGYSSAGRGPIKDPRFVGHKFPAKWESHPSAVFGGWNVYHVDAWKYLYEIIERDGAASLPHVGKYAR